MSDLFVVDMGGCGGTLLLVRGETWAKSYAASGCDVFPLRLGDKLPLPDGGWTSPVDGLWEYRIVGLVVRGTVERAPGSNDGFRAEAGPYGERLRGEFNTLERAKQWVEARSRSWRREGEQDEQTR